jgi:hypothetical protein
MSALNVLLVGGCMSTVGYGCTQLEQNGGGLFPCRLGSFGESFLGVY